VRPDVGTVVVDEDGDVANEADVAGGAVIAEGAPLLVEGELESWAMASSSPCSRRRGSRPAGSRCFTLLGQSLQERSRTAAQDGVERQSLSQVAFSRQ